MRRFIFISLISLFLAVPVWAGYSVTTGSSYGPYSGAAGEFTLEAGGGLENLLTNYSSLTTGYSNGGTTTNTFQTFCVETTEYIDKNTTYGVTLNNNAVLGGVGASGDPISVGTAYLYSQFAMGTLKGLDTSTSTLIGYDYSNSVSRVAHANLLQDTIWRLEDEIGGDLTGNIFYDAVISKFGSLALASADNYDAVSGVRQYGVYALNLTNSPNHQDQLIFVPIPATILLGLLGLGIGGWKFRKSI